MALPVARQARWPLHLGPMSAHSCSHSAIVCRSHARRTACRTMTTMTALPAAPPEPMAKADSQMSASCFGGVVTRPRESSQASVRSPRPEPARTRAKPLPNPPPKVAQRTGTRYFSTLPTPSAEGNAAWASWVISARTRCLDAACSAAVAVVCVRRPARGQSHCRCSKGEASPEDERRPGLDDVRPAAQRAGPPSPPSSSEAHRLRAVLLRPPGRPQCPWPRRRYGRNRGNPRHAPAPGSCGRFVRALLPPAGRRT